MDLQKDADFEKSWQENRHIWESTKNLARAMFYAGQAKAQAVPEGFVVVPKEPTPKMIDATWNYDDEIQDMSHNSRNEFIYNAMIEAAQEQVNESE